MRRHIQALSLSWVCVAILATGDSVRAGAAGTSVELL